MTGKETAKCSNHFPEDELEREFKIVRGTRISQEEPFYLHLYLLEVPGRLGLTHFCKITSLREALPTGQKIPQNRNSPCQLTLCHSMKITRIGLVGVGNNGGQVL